MNDRQILDIVIREMQAIGQGWRLDWSDFDGRSLRSQMDSIAAWAKRATENPGEPEFTHGTEFLKEQEESSY